jgi:hypothetical protein
MPEYITLCNHCCENLRSYIVNYNLYNRCAPEISKVQQHSLLTFYGHCFIFTFSYT